MIALVSALITWFAWQYPVDREDSLRPAPSPSLPDRSELGRVSELAVKVPRQGPVGLQPMVKVWGQAPPEHVYVVMIQAAGSEWYPTQCETDAGGETSTCGGARFGTSAKKAGSWNLVALVLTAQQAQELFQAGTYRGNVEDMEAVKRSRIYRYWR